jgi:hypothetical protein
MAIVDIQYEIDLFGQPTGMTCWSAATTMLFGSRFSAGPGQAELGPSGGLKSDFSNVSLFAKSYQLTMYAPQSWTPKGLIDLLRSGPVAMLGAVPQLHAVVIGGIKGDDSSSACSALTLTIYDPWPVGVGDIYLVDYERLMTKFPMATMYMLQR